MTAAPTIFLDPAQTVKEPRAPFPYFGGKRNAAPAVWTALGDVGHYIEPFCGSCAMLLARPKIHAAPVETVNDAFGLVVNAWRAIRDAPDEVARFCADPVMEAEYHSRLAVLFAIKEEIVPRLEGDPDWFDARLAGFFVYCQSLCIGSIWDASGPWHSVDGVLVKDERTVKDGGFIRRIPELFVDKGIHRKLPHLSGSQGIHRKLPHLSGSQGIHRELPHLSGSQGIHRELPREELVRQYLRAIRDRLSRVRIICGDWRRTVASKSSMFSAQKTVGVFLDPPYAGKGEKLYSGEATGVAAEVREWAVDAGKNPAVRIVLCGYDGEHDAVLSHGWGKATGKAGGGGYQKDKSRREMLWLSPACLANAKQGVLL